MKERGSTPCRICCCIGDNNTSVKDSLVQIDKRFFCTCFQAEHTKAICSGSWVRCVLTATKTLQSLNGIKPRQPLLGDLGSAVLCLLQVMILPTLTTLTTLTPRAREAAAPPCAGILVDRFFSLVLFFKLEEQNRTKK